MLSIGVGNYCRHALNNDFYCGMLIWFNKFASSVRLNFYVTALLRYTCAAAPGIRFLSCIPLLTARKPTGRDSETLQCVARVPNVNSFFCEADGAEFGTEVSNGSHFLLPSRKSIRTAIGSLLINSRTVERLWID